MARTVAIGKQDFADLITNDYFYIDKTYMIKEWWDNGDDVTLISRPRRFGKTLTMSMLETFFSIGCRDYRSLFEGLSIWKEEAYHALQGSYPVISISFANVKEMTYQGTRKRVNQLLSDLYRQHRFLLETDVLDEKDREFFHKVCDDMEEQTATMAINRLSSFLYSYYGKKVIILLDEYDTPMQEAYVDGYWGELVTFFRSLFNATFKTNLYLERAMMTGITRISKESIFSDLNNLKIVTITSDEYADCFGFTQEEVEVALQEYGRTEEIQNVKHWYDGFSFGTVRDIYNPWSIINFLDTGRFAAYWANTSSNSLVGKLIQTGNRDVKIHFEQLMSGAAITAHINEQIAYNELDNEEAIWSLLLASGYLKVKSVVDSDRCLYELAITNYETALMFEDMVHGWFKVVSADYRDFGKALLLNDLDAMNEYMNRVALATFSFFDTGSASYRQSEPERFYHGFVLGLMIDLAVEYVITSNRESGFGRYDIMLMPQDKTMNAYIIEFKVFNPKREKNLEQTVEVALQQIEDKEYEQTLIDNGIPTEHIYKYGFAFEGKRVLIGTIF